jgi:hypothetical protein
MIDESIFVENREVTIEYWYGKEIREDHGTATSFSSELENEPYTRYDGMILSPTDGFSDRFPTDIWIPFDNMLSVTYER